jgi:cell division protein FtsQ
MPPTTKLKATQSVGLTASVAGAVAGLLAILILVAALATGDRAERLLRGAEGLADDTQRASEAGRGLVEGRFADLGFRVGAVRLTGASKASEDEILKAAAIKPGEPILGLDLDAVRARVERVGWVRSVRVIRLLPDTVVLAVEQRPLMAIWQHHGRRDVVAVDGEAVGGVDPNGFSELPLIVGDGANIAAAALLPQLISRPRLVARLWAIRRVDGRRWDLVLKNGGVILLPSVGEAEALARLDRLDRAGRALDLDLARIDLRAANATVVRPRAPTPDVVSHGV